MRQVTLVPPGELLPILEALAATQQGTGNLYLYKQEAICELLRRKAIKVTAINEPQKNIKITPQGRTLYICLREQQNAVSQTIL